MSNPVIGNTVRDISITPTRFRQTAAQGGNFSAVLRGGADVLLTGVQLATQFIGSPVLSAAFSRARASVDPNGSIGGTGGGENPVDSMKALQDKRLHDDLELLQLQTQIQQHNRQISLMSNVLKARHETAKAAIANIRS
jgi:hypothetical protein